MAIVNISKAADMVRKTRQTLYTHNKKGKLTFDRMDDGNNGVDTSELKRVYGKLYMNAEEIDTLSSDTDSVKSDSARHNLTAKNDSIDKGLQSEIDRISELLEIERRERQREREDAKETIGELKTQRDKWEKQASSAMMRLEYQETKEKESIDLGTPEKSKRRWFGLRKAATTA